MMPQDEATLEMVIGSRICHDLASPLGAVANGLELLTLSGLRDSAELALVQDSLRGAKATLDVSRIAYGQPATGEQMGADMLQAIATAYYAGKPRLTLEWRLSGTQSRARAQIILLACFAAEQAVPRGGGLVVEGDADTPYGSSHAAHRRPPISISGTGLWPRPPCPSPIPVRRIFTCCAAALTRRGFR